MADPSRVLVVDDVPENVRLIVHHEQAGGIRHHGSSSAGAQYART